MESVTNGYKVVGRQDEKIEGTVGKVDTLSAFSSIMAIIINF